MKSYFAAFFLLLGSLVSLSAQNTHLTESKILQEDMAAPVLQETKGSKFLELTEEQPVSDQLDAFIKNYRYGAPRSDIYDTLLLNTYNFSPDEVPRYAPHVLRKRLYELPTLIQMDYNVYVQRYIDVYTIHRRDQVSRMMGLGQVYFPLFEEYLDKMNMPMELKYLSVVESALNPHARSRVGATGLWQFMLSTGRIYGLKVNSFIDERKDPVKSTIAAVKYLQAAKDEFGDWLLAIAAYNCGSGNVRKAIRRSGGKKNFWEIRAWLPRETRGYVPAFIGATYAFEHASAHNIYPTYVDFNLYSDTLHVSRLDITLNEIATITKTDLDVLKNLNPELKLDRIPYSPIPYVLRVPSVVSEYFAGNEREIRAKYGQKRNQYIPPVSYASSKSKSGSTYRPQKAYEPKAGTSLVYYTVRSGDVVGQIAEKYKVSPRQISSWNNLRRYRIKAGQKLKIYTTKNNAKAAGARQIKPSTPAPTRPQSTYSGSIVYHKVKKGETLWGIANQYDNVNVDGIMGLNRGLSARNIKIGQTIRIK